jgi:hypothetical protein
VEILEDQQDGSDFRLPIEEARDRFERPLPTLGRIETLPSSVAGRRLEQREDCRQRRLQAAIQSEQPARDLLLNVARSVVVADPKIGAHHIDDGPMTRCRSVGGYARQEHEPAIDAIRMRQLEHETRLADSRLAHDAKDLRLACLSAGHPLVNRPEFARSAHKGAQRPPDGFEHPSTPSHDASDSGRAARHGFESEISVEESRSTLVHDDFVRRRVLKEIADDSRRVAARSSLQPGDDARTRDEVGAHVDGEPRVLLVLGSQQRLQHRFGGQHGATRSIFHGLDPEHRHQFRWRELLDSGAEARERFDKVGHDRSEVERGIAARHGNRHTEHGYQPFLPADRLRHGRRRRWQHADYGWSISVLDDRAIASGDSVLAEAISQGIPVHPELSGGTRDVPPRGVERRNQTLALFSA